MKYEYGIAHHTIDICSGKVETVHRKGMTEEEADFWIKCWEEDGGKKSAFVKIRLPLGEWEIVE